MHQICQHILKLIIWTMSRMIWFYVTVHSQLKSWVLLWWLVDTFQRSRGLRYSLSQEFLQKEKLQLMYQTSKRYVPLPWRLGTLFCGKLHFQLKIQGSFVLIVTTIWLNEFWWNSHLYHFSALCVNDWMKEWRNTNTFFHVIETSIWPIMVVLGTAAAVRRRRLLLRSQTVKTVKLTVSNC